MNYVPTTSGVNLGSSDLNSVDDSIPSCLSHNLLKHQQIQRLTQNQFNQNKPKSASGSRNSLNNSRSLRLVSLDSSLLENSSLNFAQKERLAEAILKEQTEDIEKEIHKVNRYKPEIDARSHADANRQRFSYRPNLFGVVSHSAPILPTSLKQRQSSLQRHHDVIGHGPREYRWGPKAVPTVPLHVPKSHSIEKEYSDEYLSRAEIIAENKRDLLRRSVEQVKNLRTIAQEYNTEYTETKKREIAYQRNIAAFRQKIFDHLKEKNDPQMSAIMRSLQDHVIHSFIETYKGNVMSIDAVLERIGATLQPTFSNGDIRPGTSSPTPGTGTGTGTGNNSAFTTPTDGISTPESANSLFQRGNKVKKLSKLNKSYLKIPSNSDPLLQMNHREYLSRGAGFRSPNQKSNTRNQSRNGNDPQVISAYIHSPNLTNMGNESWKNDNGEIVNDDEDGLQFQAPLQHQPNPHIPCELEDSLSLESINPPRSLPPHKNLVFPSQKTPSRSNNASKWVLNQDMEPAPAPIKDSKDRSKKKKSAGPPPSQSTSRRPISTTNYGNGLYAISSYKNVLDKDYLEHL